MIRLLLALVFSGSPLILSTAFVWFNRDSSPDYWNTMPWFIILSLPVCLLTTAIAVATIMLTPSNKETTNKPKQVS